MKTRPVAGLKTSKLRLLAGVTLVISLLGLQGLAPGPATAQLPTYWIDCQIQGNTGNGSWASPFSSISQANQTISSSGYASLIFKTAGPCYTTEALILNQENVTVHKLPGANFRPKLILNALQTEHGDAAVEISADGVNLFDLEITLANPNQQACNGYTTNAGSRVGILATGNYAHIAWTDISKFYAGIHLRGRHAAVHHNNIHHNDMINLKPGNDDDAGGMGVLIWGESNTVAYNTFSANVACSNDFFAVDGTSIELFSDGSLTNENARLNIIRDNTSIDDQGFIEMGANSNADWESLEWNVIKNNTYTSSLWDATFLELRGTGTNWGPPAKNTVLIGNNVEVTDGTGVGVSCSGGNCGGTIYAFSSLMDRNNICANRHAVISPLGTIYEYC